MESLCDYWAAIPITETENKFSPIKPWIHNLGFVNRLSFVYFLDIFSVQIENHALFQSEWRLQIWSCNYEYIKNITSFDLYNFKIIAWRLLYVYPF